MTMRSDAELNGGELLPQLHPANAENGRAHVLVLPFPAQGHINPMMHLSKRLAARGVVVTFVNTLYNHERLLRSQEQAKVPLPHQQHGRQLDIRLVGLPDGLSHDDYIYTDLAKIVGAVISLEPLLAELVKAASPPVTCIISDTFFICAPGVAKLFGIPHVGFWTQSAASYATHAMILTQGFRPQASEHPVINGVVQNLITSIPGCPPLRFSELNTFLQSCDPSDVLFSYVTQCFNSAPESALVLFNTFHELEGTTLQAIWEPNMRTIGPVLPEQFVLGEKGQERSSGQERLGTSLWPEDDGCVEWLDKQERASVLYVSFGSITMLSAAQVGEFAAGLEASGSPILMVVRPALMFGREAVFPASFAECGKSGRAKFVEWCPQLEVLAHPAVGGFLTHCGWNSTLESISRSTPMLCWPYFADQMMNCRCVVDGWRVGLDLERQGGGCDAAAFDVSQAEIERKVRLLMAPDGEERTRMKARLAKLSRAAQEAVKPQRGASFRDLESLVAFLTDAIA